MSEKLRASLGLSIDVSNVERECHLEKGTDILVNGSTSSDQHFQISSELGSHFGKELVVEAMVSLSLRLQVLLLYSEGSFE